MPAAPRGRAGQRVAAIARADLVVLGPGSLYTSVIPNGLLPWRCARLLAGTRAWVVYACSGDHRKREIMRD